MVVPRASARDEVLGCDVAEVSQVDGRAVAVLDVGDQDARVSCDGGDGIVGGGASSDDGSRHDGVIFDGNVGVSRQGSACSLVVPADDVFRRGVSPVSVLVWRLVPHSLVTPPAMMPNAPPLMSIQMSPW